MSSLFKAADLSSLKKGQVRIQVKKKNKHKKTNNKKTPQTVNVTVIFPGRVM